ncbi:MAG: aldose 1-epimerase family protein [Janthinobacterium lividum]
MANGAVTVHIGTSRLSAEIALKGAELIRLRDEEGRDLLWNGDPTFWTGRAPILFPIVGRLKDDHLSVDGTSYPMRQHGIARTSLFTLAERNETSCRLRLDSDETTRQAYPFDFALDLTYRIAAAALTITGTVHNPGPVALPVSFGFHPAFRWPLPYGAAAGDHVVTFAEAEPAPLATLKGGLLTHRRKPTPVEGRRLTLTPHLFDEDALILLAPASRSLRYGPEHGRGLTIGFDGMPQLGIWSKPGAPFVCLEPWSGYASPVDFAGDIADKPGMTAIAPGDSRSFAMSVSLDAP